MSRLTVRAVVAPKGDRFWWCEDESGYRVNTLIGIETCRIASGRCLCFIIGPLNVGFRWAAKKNRGLA